MFFTLEVGSRNVHILEATSHAAGAWTTHARNLLMGLDDRAATFGFLVRDRAGQFTTSFDAVLAGAGIGPMKITAMSENELLGRALRPDPPEPNSPTAR